MNDFLGMTWDEYKLWAELPRSLRFIIAARESGDTVEHLLETADEHAIAARGLDPADAERVRDWLKETGRLQ